MLSGTSVTDVTIEDEGSSRPRGRPRHRPHDLVHRWSSPDRFLALRTQSEDSRSFQTSKSPYQLRGRELYTRSRDASVNPFRSVSASRAQEHTADRIPNSRGPQPPSYTPSFVHGTTTASVNLDPRRPPDTPRHPSWGTF